MWVSLERILIASWLGKRFGDFEELLELDVDDHGDEHVDVDELVDELSCMTCSIGT